MNKFFAVAAIATFVAHVGVVSMANAATSPCAVVNGIRAVKLQKETAIAAVYAGSKAKTIVVWYKKKTGKAACRTFTIVPKK